MNPNRAEIQFTVAGKTLNGWIQVQQKEIALDLDVNHAYTWALDPSLARAPARAYPRKAQET